MKNKKGFANMVLIWVIVVVVAIGGYFVFVKRNIDKSVAKEKKMVLNSKNSILAFNIREECEINTKKQCVIAECDYTPADIKPQNICLNDYKYWTPSGKEVLNTTNWKIYTNSEYGFEFQYPENWVKGVGKNSNTFNFSTSDGHKAYFELVPNLSGGEDLNNNDKYVMLGDEILRERVMTSCGVGGLNLCVVSLNYVSAKTNKKGFGFSVFITNIGKEDYDSTSPNNSYDPSYSFDPYPFFEKEIIEVQKILSTFKFTK